MSEGRYERELVNALDECGYVAMRAPSSGSATGRDLPDVLAGRGDIYDTPGPASFALAIEHKSTSATTAYADEGEVEALVRFAEAFGAVPLVGARFKTQAAGKYHYLVEPSECRRTQGGGEGNYGVPRSDASERASFVVNATGPTFVRNE